MSSADEIMEWSDEKIVGYMEDMEKLIRKAKGEVRCIKKAFKDLKRLSKKKCSDCKKLAKNSGKLNSTPIPFPNLETEITPPQSITEKTPIPDTVKTTTLEAVKVPPPGKIAPLIVAKKRLNDSGIDLNENQCSSILKVSSWLETSSSAEQLMADSVGDSGFTEGYLEERLLTKRESFFEVADYDGELDFNNDEYLKASMR